MKRAITLLGIVALSTAGLAAQTTTTTKQTTVQQLPDGATRIVQYTGEVVSYEPGKTIVLRHPDSQVVTYTIAPRVTVPTEVQVGRVTLVTEPGASGTTMVTRVTTVTTSPASAPEPQTSVSTSRETVVQSPSGTQTTTTTTKTTTVTGEVVRLEPGRSIVLRGPDSKVITYTLAPSLSVPAEVQAGRRVILYTEPAASGVLVTRITTVSPDGAAVTRETVTTGEATAPVTTVRTTTVAGEVVRYEPGQTIVLRQPDSQVVTYTLSPSMEAPPQVIVGRRVTVTTQPSSSGPVVVTRITTETTSAGGMTETTTEKTMASEAGEAQFTTVYGTISAYQPGKTVTLVRPNKTKVTYVIDPSSELPTDLAIGKSVTIRTTTVAGSQRPVVRRVTYRTSTTKKKTVS